MIPLHYICSRKLNKNLLISIQALISAYPEGIDVEDDLWIYTIALVHCLQGWHVYDHAPTMAQ